MQVGTAPERACVAPARSLALALQPAAAQKLPFMACGTITIAAHLHIIVTIINAFALSVAMHTGTGRAHQVDHEVALVAKVIVHKLGCSSARMSSACLCQASEHFSLLLNHLPGAC